MSDIGKPIREDVIIRRVVPEIISVPVRPSERAARRRKLWEGPKPEPEKQPIPVRRKEESPS